MTYPTNNSEQGMSFFRQFLVCLGICCSVFLAAYLWDSYISQTANVRVQTITPITEQVSAPSSGVRTKKIQEVEVGERAVGMNPELTDSERSAFLPDPEPATWRKLTLEMIKPNGKRLDITLLRPLSWIGESQADIDATIYLDLPEMGAQGFAKVRNIEPCPPIKRGKGNVITGTFHHEAANTIDLHVEGLSKPIGCTDNHPFWSVTRNDFVEAGKLLPGEELQLYNGQNAKVVQILPRPGPEWVHNIEVLNEHVYRVSDVGLLVHNTCTGDPPDTMNRPHNHHIVMQGSFSRWGTLKQAFVTGAQGLLTKYGIDFKTDQHNRTWAENKGHSAEYAEKIFTRLKNVEKDGLDQHKTPDQIKESLYNELDKLAKEIENGEF